MQASLFQRCNDQRHDTKIQCCCELQRKAGSNLGQLKLETVPHLTRQMWALKSGRLSTRQSSRSSFPPIYFLICWLFACAGFCCWVRTVCPVLWPALDKGQKTTSENVKHSSEWCCSIFLENSPSWPKEFVTNLVWRSKEFRVLIFACYSWCGLQEKPQL